MFETARDYFQIEQKSDVVGAFLSPVHQNYEKRKPTLIAANHRVKMCQEAVSDSDWINIDDWEVSQNEYSRTLFVLKHFESELQNQFGEDGKRVRVILLCGADLLESFVKPGVWIPEQVGYILENFGVCCIERGGVSITNLIFEHDVLYRNKKNIHVIPEWIINDVSSTKVRQLVRRGYSIKYYVMDSVEKYIREHDLYSEPIPPTTNSSIALANHQL